MHILNTINQWARVSTAEDRKFQEFQNVSLLLFLCRYVDTQHDEPSDVCSQ
jgi:hypothetical protein